MSDQYLSFFVAGEEYGITILQITEIIAAPAITRVPGTPTWIRGVVNLRGTVLPVIDLASKFGSPETEITPRTCVVIVEMKNGDDRVIAGIMADSVHQVVALGSDSIQAPPAFGPRVRIDDLQGMALIDEKFVLLLDVDHVLAWDDVAAVAREAAP